MNKEQPTPITSLECPRCGTLLLEHEPSAIWLRWFECRECSAAYHFILGSLHVGRLRSPMYAASETRQ